MEQGTSQSAVGNKIRLKRTAIGAIAIFMIASVALAVLWKRPRGVLIPKQSLVIWDPASLPPGRPMAAEAKYELVNEGKSPVRILGVESGCGCAKPVVDKDVVLPGKTAIVSVSALVPQFGTQEVQFKVNTDSSIRPEINLTMKILGVRKPPYLLSILGDLSYPEGSSLVEKREVTVTSAEPVKENGTFPKLSTDLPFLRIEEGGTEERLRDGDFVLRKRKYRIGFSKKPPPGTAVGYVAAEDPWNPGSILKLSVDIRTHSALTAVPPDLRIEDSADLVATVLITKNEPGDEIEARVEDDGKLRFSVETTSMEGSKRYSTVKIKLVKPRPSKDCQAMLKVISKKTRETLDIPISISAEPR